MVASPVLATEAILPRWQQSGHTGLYRGQQSTHASSLVDSQYFCKKGARSVILDTSMPVIFVCCADNKMETFLLFTFQRNASHVSPLGTLCIGGCILAKYQEQLRCSTLGRDKCQRQGIIPTHVESHNT